MDSRRAKLAKRVGFRDEAELIRLSKEFHKDCKDHPCLVCRVEREAWNDSKYIHETS